MGSHWAFSPVKAHRDSVTESKRVVGMLDEAFEAPCVVLIPT